MRWKKRKNRRWPAVSGQWSRFFQSTGYRAQTAQDGFTLIELMIAASIMGLIGLAILTTFGSGFRVYERVQSFGGIQANALFALEEFEKDLENTFPLSTIPVEGNTSRIAFPAIIEIPGDENGEEEDASSIGKISYYLGSTGVDANVFIRSRVSYSQASSKHEPGDDESEELVSLNDVQFSYYWFDKESGKYGWADSWDPENTNRLAGVKITMTYKDMNRDVELSRIVYIRSAREAAEDEEGEGDGEGEGEGA